MDFGSLRYQLKSIATGGPQPYIPMLALTTIVGSQLAQVPVWICHKVLALLMGLHYHQVGLSHHKHLQAWEWASEMHCKVYEWLGHM